MTPQELQALMGAVALRLAAAAMQIGALVHALTPWDRIPDDAGTFRALDREIDRILPPQRVNAYEVVQRADDLVRDAMAQVEAASAAGRDVVPRRTDIAAALPRFFASSSGPSGGDYTGFLVSPHELTTQEQERLRAAWAEGRLAGVIFPGGTPVEETPDLPPLRASRTILPHPEDK